MRLLLYALILLPAAAGRMSAQSVEPDHAERPFSAAVMLGVPVASEIFPTIALLTTDHSPYILMPVIAGSAELRYRMTTVYGCSFSATATIGYAKVVPNGPIPVVFTVGEREQISGSISRIPLLAGLRMDGGSILSPFIAAGAGIASTRYVHTVSDRGDLSFDTSAVQYCWNVSGGLRYTAGSHLSYEFLVTSWLTETTITRQLLRETIGIPGRFAMTTIGFSAAYIL